MEERRNFCRVEDDVILEYEVTNEKTSLERYTSSDTAMELQDITKELRNMDARSQSLIKDISRDNYEVAEYFRVINQKIEFLATFIANEVIAKLVLNLSLIHI